MLLARGSQVAKLQAEATPGTAILNRLILSPDWLATGVTDALGGGPVIVRNGKPVWTAGEDFLPSQLAPRNPRTAVGQRADGKIVLLAVDGRRRGFSVGMTNWELAQAMVRLGCVTASALDAGGSTTMAFDGKLLNRPSDPGGERSVAESLDVALHGRLRAAADARRSSRRTATAIAERQLLSYKVVRPSTVTASLLGPGGATGFTETVARQPGHLHRTRGPATAKTRRAQAEPLGRWRWVISATDDTGQASSVERSFWLNDTLGFMSVAPRCGAAPPEARAPRSSPASSSPRRPA